MVIRVVCHVSLEKIRGIRMNKDLNGRTFASVKDVHDQFEDVPTLEEMSTYRYILIDEEGDYSASIICIYHAGNSYYEITEDRCSCRGYYWNPIEVVEEYLLKQYPGIDLNAHIFEHLSNIS
jgi:hypothetical protein